MNFLVLPRLTVNLPTANVNITKWKIPTGVELADPSFFVSKGVDVVLGIEAFFEFFENGQNISIGERMPRLNKSVFGWVVSGGVSTEGQTRQVKCNIAATEELDKLISRFWSCEEVEFSSNYSPDEMRCENLFASTVQRGSDGRYTVSLPKDEDALLRLGESREIARRRFHGLERRLARDAELRKQYVTFMQEYEQMGHMRKVEDDTKEKVKRCYLPHHPVVKEASTTTKVRVVFDASCKTSSSISLNDVLLAGPVIQEDLRSIILRCRIKEILLISDVEKMFRQINMSAVDSPLQSILWRSTPTEEIATYELGTVTYGTKPAPFLATRTLKQLAEDEQASFPLAARAATEDTYMDDIITGANEVDEAINLREQLDRMLSSGGFRLRKWASNHPQVLHGLPKESLAIPESGEIELDPNPTVKTLGLTWMPKTDELRFQFSIPPMDPAELLTKRKILSTIASCFDPLGIIGATVTRAKIFMQLLWTLRLDNDKRLDWDQTLPSTVGETWKRFYLGLPLLNQIRIERCVIIPRAVNLELHCFSDASKDASGACVYVRSQDAEGRVIVRLLTSKSKVAPIKCQSIPRLELCGAVLSAQLFEKVQQAIKIPVRAHFWTDSTCVLRWIRATPTTWTTFVANRVAKIQNITEGNQWRHVPGVQNPADLISRGISPEEITDNQLWWQGPEWLADLPQTWPKCLGELSNDLGEDERRRTVAVNVASSIALFNEEFIGRFSVYMDLVRCTAIWQRFMRVLQTKEHQLEYLSTAELKQAEKTIIRLVQQETFADEWKALMNGEPVSRRSPLRWFNPFIDKDNLIRIGGRLRNSEESEDVKHPAVLPARHRFTRLVLKHYHEKLLHAGPQLLLSVIRLKLWPLGGRNVARQIVHQCHKCYRCKPSLIKQHMGDLPSPRVTVSRPFAKTGVDYFGPIYIRPGPRRTAIKAYVALFVCMSTKAIHMELVSDLSTDRFLQALRRFFARRGKSTDIYSDNGTNFVGARNKMKEVLELLRASDHKEQIYKYCAEREIRWHFSPPSGPHFGGLWEAAVKSAKFHILRVIGENPLSIEDMTTLLVQIEGCLNSRPITQLSNDPSDLAALTPAHFLIGSSLEAIPEPNLESIPTNRLKHWEQIQAKLQHFWRRWKREYLAQLQARTKRWRPAIPIEIGRLVVICNENLPPMRWRLGRIIDTHPGDDGIVRVVTIKTAAGTFKRPVEKICFLPTPEDTDI